MQLKIEKLVHLVNEILKKITCIKKKINCTFFGFWNIVVNADLPRKKYGISMFHLLL